MSKQAYYVHLKNKFPSAEIKATESSIHAYRNGEHLCAVEKNGLGIWKDAQDEYGCKFKFSLDPLPKDCRFMKLFKDGKIGPSEEYAERLPRAKAMESKFGFVPSQDEFDKKKYEFNT